MAEGRFGVWRLDEVASYDGYWAPASWPTIEISDTVAEDLLRLGWARRTEDGGLALTWMGAHFIESQQNP